MDGNRRFRQATPLAAGQERLELRSSERTGRERGIKEEDIPLSPAYMDGDSNMRDLGLRQGRDFIPDNAWPIRRMKTGGVVRGDGCCQRGHTKGRMR